METPPATTGRERSRNEELANSLSHGAGLLAAVIAAPILIVHAVNRGNVNFIVGASIFAATMILLYATSTLYHALPPGKLKHIFRVIEHAAIFLLIAGTYTPFTLGVLHGGWGWTLFGMIWGMAAVGVLLKIIVGATHPIAFVSLYVFMGWVMAVAAKPLYTQLPSTGLAWLLAGGLSYTMGVAFFAADSRLQYGHFIWHLFVLAGTSCHYFAILWYAA